MVGEAYVANADRGREIDHQRLALEAEVDARVDRDVDAPVRELRGKGRGQAFEPVRRAARGGRSRGGPGGEHVASGPTATVSRRSVFRGRIMSPRRCYQRVRGVVRMRARAGPFRRAPKLTPTVALRYAPWSSRNVAVSWTFIGAWLSGRALR